MRLPDCSGGRCWSNLGGGHFDLLCCRFRYVIVHIVIRQIVCQIRHSKWLVVNGRCAKFGASFFAWDIIPTFNLPNFNDRVPWWTPGGAGNTGSGSAPKITGVAGLGAGLTSQDSCAVTDTSGCFVNNDNGKVFSTGAGGYVSRNRGLKFDASRSSGSYNRTDNKIIPSYLKIGSWVIKYI